MTSFHRNTIITFSQLLLVASTAASENVTVDFATQIAPLFQRRCVRCHSPEINKGDFSLATSNDLRANEYVVPGDPDASYLWKLVTPHDGEPPAMPKESDPLAKNEVKLLRDWIQQGAKWPAEVVVRARPKADSSWWSLQPLQSAANSPANIDGFIQAKLKKHGLQLSPQADRRTLIRRLSFDLHGLPPTPAAVDAFINDTDPKAYEKLVDRFLDSYHYGERFARHWLDIAHYADTHGFERDKRRDNAWRYRDYVIQAFNDDKPYDRFLEEQIAGDVLWPGNEPSVIATGFLAAGPWDFVGQVETKSLLLRRSARSLDLDDMATQVMTATMAMTVNCARCHDHKLDPITQQEYYQLRAVFAGVKRQERVVNDEALKQYEDNKKAIVERLNEIRSEIAQLEGAGLQLADMVGGGNGFGTGRVRSGIDPRTAEVQTRDLGALRDVVTNKYMLSTFEFVDGVFIPDGKENRSSETPVQSPVIVTSTGVTVAGLPKTSGAAWDAIRNGPVASQHSPKLGGIDFTKDGHTLLGLHANAGITFDLHAMRKAGITSPIADRKPNEQEQSDAPVAPSALRFTAQVGYFGAKGAYHADAWVFVDGKKATEFKRLRREDGLQAIDVKLPSSARFLTLVATDGGNGYSHDQIGFGDPQVKPAMPLELSADTQLRLEHLHHEQTQLLAKQESLQPPPRFYGVVSEQTMPAVRLLARGDPESPTGESLRPAALSTLRMLDPNLGERHTSEGERRAALAQWITHPANPLTRRVIANRLWQWHFGTGIVDTSSDFGFGGGRPSHPELLDWLAAELDHNNGSLKSMHRLIVNSATYKQGSRTAQPKAMQVDADNRMLWRQNPRRIEAEAIRDAVLRTSGKLNMKRGGPGFEDFEYQEAYAPIYTYVTADQPATWRRSIYRYIVRTTPNRFLTTLDCPDPANLTARRLTTTTPLQSLALFNNDFMLRQARYFAERVEQEAMPSVREQVRRAFELAFSRQPTGNESELATKLVTEHGLFHLCRSLLNSNEFVYVD